LGPNQAWDYFREPRFPNSTSILEEVITRGGEREKGRGIGWGQKNSGRFENKDEGLMIVWNLKILWGGGQHGEKTLGGPISRTVEVRQCSTGTTRRDLKTYKQKTVEINTDVVKEKIAGHTGGTCHKATKVGSPG